MVRAQRLGRDRLAQARTSRVRELSIAGSRQTEVAGEVVRRGIETEETAIEQTAIAVL